MTTEASLALAIFLGLASIVWSWVNCLRLNDLSLNLEILDRECSNNRIQVASRLYSSEFYSLLEHLKLECRFEKPKTIFTRVK